MNTEYDLLRLTKTINLYNDNLESKGKRYLKKIVEKLKEFLMMMTYLSEDVKITA